MASQKRIGIMADSHGDFSAIAAAIAFFKLHACDRVYHLGDICDSSHPETARECVDLLHHNHVFAVKGNNDHTLVVNHEGYAESVVPSGTLEYLKQLPLVLRHKEAVFTHGLPFVAEKGLSCMVGTFGAAELSSFFQKYPRNLLFRGHQHFPELVWREKGKVLSRKTWPGESIPLGHRLPCIVTCGAVDHRFCIIWETDKQLISCHQCM